MLFAICIATWLVAGCAKIIGIADYELWDAGGGPADADARPVDVPGDAPFGMFGTYLKASNTGTNDIFGTSIAMSEDGATLVVGASQEDSAANTIDGDQTSNAAGDAGAVYVFVRSGMAWTQQAYLKAGNAGGNDRFGQAVAISADGSTIAVGAPNEDGSAVGIDGANNNNAGSAGAVYVFVRNGATWSQQAYVKPSNTDTDDQFGTAVALAIDGNTLAVGAPNEDSNATTINGSQADADASTAGSDFGAAYVFVRAGATWVQQAYVKASNSDNGDRFGSALALSSDGDTLVAAAPAEDSNATGINGNQSSETSTDAGAVYTFRRVSGIWAQQAYIKATNTNSGDRFGTTIALSSDGSTLAVGAPLEDSNETGIGGTGANNSASNSGAVYTYALVAATWTVDTYIKPSNTGANDQFGIALALSADGALLLVGANLEDSAADGTGGNEADNTATDAGAVFAFTRATTWSQSLYVKATMSEANDRFGQAVAVGGGLFAMGAPLEDSAATGIGGDQASNLAASSGAVYVLQ